MRMLSVFMFISCMLSFLVACEAQDKATAESTSEMQEEPSLVIPDGANPASWEAEISAFEQADLESPPPQGGIVFVGSSSIRLWNSLEEDMAPLPVVRRGFGGSRLFDATYYVDRIITPYNPKMLVVFSGTNDIAGENPKQPAEVVALYDQFVDRVHAQFPDLPIYYIAISPTRSRWQHKDIVFETNQLIADKASADERLFFIDTATALLGSDGEPNDDLFVSDQLHLNEKGYAVWTSIIKPVLLNAWGEMDAGNESG